MSKKFLLPLMQWGDNSPDKTIEGIKMFIEKNKNNNDFILNVFGKENIIKEKLVKEFQHGFYKYN